MRELKQIWQGRALEMATRYGDSAPVVTTCCNACRTCATTSIATLALGALAAAGAGLTRFAKRFTGV
jgi:hypothetical protein